MTTPIIIDDFFVSKAIALSQSATYVVDLKRMNAEGFFSLQIALTGDGTAKGEYLESNDNSTFIDPEDDIFSGFTKTSGPGSDGKDLFSFEPNLCGFLQLKFTETGGANGIVLTCSLAIQ